MKLTQREQQIYDRMEKLRAQLDNRYDARIAELSEQLDRAYLRELDTLIESLRERGIATAVSDGGE